MKNYVKVSAIYKKLKEAQKCHTILYISGAVGFGKTSAIEYFFRKQKYEIISGKNGYLTEFLNIEDVLSSVVIFDDISWIDDGDTQRYILGFIEQNLAKKEEDQKQIVLIGRSELPSWLRILAIEEPFMFADERDLVLTESEAKKFFENRKIELKNAEFHAIMKESKGHALSLIYTAYHLSEGVSFGLECIEQVKLDLYHYFDHAFYENWDIDMKEVLLAVCQYRVFTLDLLKMITGNNKVALLLQKAKELGTFLEKHDSKTFVCRPILRDYLIWKQTMLYTKKQIEDNYERAALYYEIHDQVELALKYYELAGNQDKVSAILVKNAKKHPGTAHFFETREYYFALPKKSVQQSPVLMSGMSILYSIMLQPKESEMWYQELVLYEQKAQRGSVERKEASIRLAYLNIALPHRGIHGIINILKNTAILCRNKNVKLPEFSVTSNLPSVMNGGLDFCEWSKNDKELAILMKKPVEIVLGKYGIGLVNIALAESGFEKGSMDSYEIMTRLNTGYMMSDTSGKIEMCFAATGLMIKEHIANGQGEISRNLLSNFHQKVIKENALQLIDNMTAFELWLSMMLGDVSKVEEWVNNAPNENIAFCILDRYQYMQKVRGLIVLGKLDMALHLVERLDVYFTQYERHYLHIENQILKAIILYRLKNKEWEGVIRAALLAAQHYQFIRVFANEGVAIKPLLDKLKNANLQRKYLKRVKIEVDQMAMYYPNYLRQKRELKEPLTDAEKKVIKLLCEGISSDEICHLCGFTNSGLKFHNKNIYRKLGVSSRSEAEREAHRLGLDS